MDNILGRGHETHLPGMDSTADMLNAFSNCFNDKVLKIRESLNVTVVTDSPILSKHHLSTFKESTEDEVRHGDHEISNKSCMPDPITTHVLKEKNCLLVGVGYCAYHGAMLALACD